VNRALLCDLDDTLFDHSGATRAALAVVRDSTSAFQAWSLGEFDRHHRVVLEALHLEVLAGSWTVDEARVERFRQLLKSAGIDESSADVLDGLSWSYRRAYEAAWRMVPGAVQLAAAVKAAGWQLVIVTNNVVREQRLKVERGGLAPYVDALVTSEEFGASKPDPRIILHAIERAGSSPECAIVFGDSLATDIAGGRAAGVRAVWFNRWRAETPDPDLEQVHTLEPVADVMRMLVGDRQGQRAEGKGQR
jgi:HAD superfamily hydrolase (TIGR01549 family)